MDAAGDPGALAKVFGERHTPGIFGSLSEPVATVRGLTSGLDSPH